MLLKYTVAAGLSPIFLGMSKNELQTTINGEATFVQIIGKVEKWRINNLKIILYFFENSLIEIEIGPSIGVELFINGVLIIHNNKMLNPLPLLESLDLNKEVKYNTASFLTIGISTSDPYEKNGSICFFDVHASIDLYRS